MLSRSRNFLILLIFFSEKKADLQSKYFPVWLHNCVRAGLYRVIRWLQAVRLFLILLWSNRFKVHLVVGFQNIPKAQLTWHSAQLAQWNWAITARWTPVLLKINKKLRLQTLFHHECDYCDLKKGRRYIITFCSTLISLCFTHFYTRKKNIESKI